MKDLRRQTAAYVVGAYVASTAIAWALTGTIEPSSLRAQSARVARAESDADVTSREVLARRVTLSLDHVSLRNALRAAAIAGHVVLEYRGDEIDHYTTPITLHVTDVPLGVALEQLLAATALELRPMAEGHLAIRVGQHGADHVAGGITGRVVDAATKKPLAGVTATIDNASRGVMTDTNGVYRIGGVAAGSHRVAVRLLGHSRQTRVVTVVDGESAVADFSLEASTTVLDQVVVTGTVAPTELKAVPNAMTVITAKEIEERGITRIDQLFHGDVPGIYSSNFGDHSQTSPGFVQMASRGSTYLSFPLGPAIKTYIDGVELANPDFLGLIDPKSIERIEILTGPQASTIYGSNAINGVMQVFTKRGTTPRPQLVATLQSGVIQNNFSSSLAPQHNDMVQISGVDGHTSYNLGGSWVYMGSWTPTVHATNLSGFGGARMQQGMVTVDVTGRLLRGSNWQNSTGQVLSTAQQDGTLRLNPSGYALHQWTAHTTQTLGLTATVAPTSWWSTTATAGMDNMNQYTSRRPGYHDRSDSLSLIDMGPQSRQSLAYSTTVQIPFADLARGTITVGGDGWKYTNDESYFTSTSLTSQTTSHSSEGVTHTASHNRGGYLQSQLGLWDALFFTYGLRAEWNPDYGANIRPNYTPRYGVSYTQSFGSLTAKLRAAYGSATRPPLPGESQAITMLQQYGGDLGPYWAPDDLLQRGNPNLLPEHQKGGEGGLELYWGNTASVTITRYNQTVGDLIDIAVVDSIHSLVPYTELGWPAGSFPQYVDGYLYNTTMEFINIGNIRNSGWETQATVTTGPFTTKGTFSFMKSRIIGVRDDPSFKALSHYVVGSAFSGAPEHTWALGSTYSHGGTSVLLNLHGQGFMHALNTGASGTAYFLAQGRLMQQKARASIPIGWQWYMSAYAIGDLNATQRITPNVDALFQMQNISDKYRNDQFYASATIGRQTQFGLRIRF